MIRSSVILNFLWLLRPRKVNLKNITNFLALGLQFANFFLTHFSWPQYLGKIQNYTRTNYSNSKRSCGRHQKNNEISNQNNLLGLRKDRKKIKKLDFFVRFHIQK